MFFLPDWGKNLLDGGSKQKPPHRKDAGAIFMGSEKTYFPLP
jgi:hypothetical protein